MTLLTTTQCLKVFGTPTENPAYLTTILLPFPLRLAWDTDTKVSRIRVHKLVAPFFLAVFTDLLSTYGYDKIQELGIDLYGGVFSFRAKRGGTSWSKHAWGIAIDLDPARNKLKENSTTARFARPEYQPMIDIFYKHGFVSLGKEQNFDWMHFEFTNLNLLEN